jgi:hypothetical protein
MAIINSYPTVTPQDGDLVVLTDVSTTPNSTKTATVGSIASQVTLGYNSYVANWTQAGEAADSHPVPVELYNNTGLTWTATRSSKGVYRFTASENFGTKVYAIASDRGINSGGTLPASTGTNVVAVNEAGPTFVSVENRDSADKSLVDNVQAGMIEIRIYS